MLQQQLLHSRFATVVVRNSSVKSIFAEVKVLVRSNAAPISEIAFALCEGTQTSPVYSPANSSTVMQINMGPNRSTGRRTHPSATLTTTHLTWSCPWSNPDLHGERRRLTTWAMARFLRLKWSYALYKDPFRTAQKTKCVSITLPISSA